MGASVQRFGMGQSGRVTMGEGIGYNSLERVNDYTL